MKNPTHVCRACGAASPRWSGRCGGCGEWNTLEVAPTRTRVASTATTPLVDVDVAGLTLRPTGVGEFDRVLGGGLAPGSSTLLYGEPGVGKSTLALMVLLEAARRAPALLIAAEESVAQVARRARRLGEVPESLDVGAVCDLASAADLVASARAGVVVVDSLSAMNDAQLGGAAGSVTQLRHGAERLSQAARATSTSLILVGHVTKDGDLAGPRALEHLVDTVIRIEGDRQGTLRILRAQKHRFGPTGEIGLLEMDARGLRDLPEPTLTRAPAAPGVVLGVTNDGTRSLVVEVQALVVAAAASPRRVAHQVSGQRLALLLAVLEARCGVATGGCDVFAATAGGLPATDPGIDVALALAIASATAGFVVARDVAAVGEVGLAGELRSVVGLARRVREAQRRGASTVIVPAEGELEGVEGARVVRCATLGDAIAALTSRFAQSAVE
ncbi:MAG: AAA family ATPase [Acidobacteriota bacterium]|nr:AAA family ATPase [Acidobacteriota bacterium]